MSYVIFKKLPRGEAYATREPAGFAAVLSVRDTNLTFDTARQAYEFAGGFAGLQHWRVGRR